MTRADGLARKNDCVRCQSGTDRLGPAPLAARLLDPDSTRAVRQDVHGGQQSGAVAAASSSPRGEGRPRPWAAAAWEQ